MTLNKRCRVHKCAMETEHTLCTYHRGLWLKSEERREAMRAHAEGQSMGVFSTAQNEWRKRTANM